MEDVQIHETAEVSEQAIIGKGTKIWHHVQIREGAQIGENCSIGKGVYIDNEVKIGNRVKIQNGVGVYRGVTIEDDVLLGPYCSFTNDPYPRAFPADWQVVPTLLKKGCSIGANATVVCGVTIGEYSLIAAGAVVTVDTLPFSCMLGNPARLKNFVCLCGRELRTMKGQASEIKLECDKCRRILCLQFKLIEP
jgi:acetyltransferase-like isoleucine patch superfamily enzyme